MIGSVFVDQVNRTVLEVYYDILTVTTEATDLVKLKDECRMGHKVAIKMLNRLNRAKLLEAKDGLYMTTEKGQLFLAYMDDLIQTFKPSARPPPSLVKGV